MKETEDILREWEEEYDTLIENTIYDFYTSIDEDTRTGAYSFYMYYDKSKWRNISFLGVKYNLQVYKTHNGIKKERLDRLEPVSKNIVSKTLYRYLIKTYIEEGLKPSLKDLNIDDEIKLMRNINMSSGILKINFTGDIWFMGNLKDNKHSFCITFPRGVFVRKKDGQERYEKKYNTDRPQYTWMEIYEGINGFDIEDAFQ